MHDNNRSFDGMFVLRNNARVTPLQAVLRYRRAATALTGLCRRRERARVVYDGLM